MHWLTLILVSACILGCLELPDDQGTRVHTAPLCHAEPAPLPECDRACDRVVDCAVDHCKGYPWSNTRPVADACYATCDATSQAIFEADTCDDVLALFPEVHSYCEENPCEASCDYLSACIIEGCPAHDLASQDDLFNGCLRDCDPDGAGWVWDFASCQDLVSALSQGDDTFRTWCEGTPSGCAPESTCSAYATKISGCVLSLCNGNADPFEAGLTSLIQLNCAFGDECPPPAEVEGFLNPELTCDVIAGIANDPTFGTFCDGTAIDPSATENACAALRACPEAGWLPDNATCNAFINILPNTSAVVPCMDTARDCPALLSCLEAAP